MADPYAGLPVVRCPECGSGDQVEIIRPVHERRDGLGPGDWAHFDCRFCHCSFTGIVPEPVEMSQ